MRSAGEDDRREGLRREQHHLSQHRVLVTGGSGLIGGHVILELLAQGCLVRATVRSLDREDDIRAWLTEAGMTAGDDLEFAAAGLTCDTGWPEAMDGVDYVIHVASPVMPGHVADEKSVIVPPCEGALRVLLVVSIVVTPVSVPGLITGQSARWSGSGSGLGGRAPSACRGRPAVWPSRPRRGPGDPWPPGPPIIARGGVEGVSGSAQAGQRGLNIGRPLD